MKAIRYHSHGEPEVLVYEETDRPAAEPGQVVLRVAGTGFNPVDVALRMGILRERFPFTLPHIPNIEVAGTIAELGDGVTGWQPGDAVIAFLPMTAPGGAAEYVAVAADLLAAAPRTVELAEAAALPVAALTAWQAVNEHAELGSGQSVLINGAGGAVGGYAVQFAADNKARITATAGPRSRDRLSSYGVDDLVDYTTTPIREALAHRRFDVVLNLVRDDDTASLLDLVADGGRLVSTTGPAPDDPNRGVRMLPVFLHPDAAGLAELAARVDTGTLRFHVDATRPLTDLPAVHTESLAGRLPGKTVLVP